MRPQAPIARVIVSEDGPAQVLLYAPGLPVGEHDVYLEPADQPKPAPCDGGTCGLGGYCEGCPETKAADQQKPTPCENCDGAGWVFVRNHGDIPCPLCNADKPADDPHR